MESHLLASQMWGLNCKELLGWNEDLCAKWVWKIKYEHTVFTQWEKEYLLKGSDILYVRAHTMDAPG